MFNSCSRSGNSELRLRQQLLQNRQPKPLSLHQKLQLRQQMLQICMATWAAKMATEVAAVATASAGGASACYTYV